MSLAAEVRASVNWAYATVVASAAAALELMAKMAVAASLETAARVATATAAAGRQVVGASVVWVEDPREVAVA